MSSSPATCISGDVLLGISNILTLLYDEEIQAATAQVLDMCRGKLKQLFADARVVKSFMFKVPEGSARTVVQLKTFFRLHDEECITGLNSEHMGFAVYKTSLGVLSIFITSNSPKPSLITVGQCGLLDNQQNACVGCTNDPSLGPEHRVTITEVDARLCSACLEPARFKCSRCWYGVGVSVRYCGRECQLEHWQGHKRVCGGDGFD